MAKGLAIMAVWAFVSGCCMFGEDLSSSGEFAGFEAALTQADSPEAEAKSVAGWNKYVLERDYNTYSVTFQDAEGSRVAVEDVPAWLDEHPDRALWVELDYNVTCGPQAGRLKHQVIDRSNWRQFVVDR